MSRGPEEAAEQLRELIREANGAIKDLRQVLREVRQAVAGAADEAAAAAAEAGSSELRRYSNHLQEEMNRQSAELKEAVDKARARIIRMLALKAITSPDNGKTIRAEFAAGNFDSDILLPYGPGADDTGR